MITVTQQQLDALKNNPTVLYCVDIQIGSTIYHWTTGDITYARGFTSYLPGLLDEIDEIEITSTPKTNDINLMVSDPEKAIITSLLSQTWMNKPIEITKIILDANGDLIMEKSAFKGYLSEYSIDSENSVVELTCSSIWADFEKQSGVKTNPKSQQRFWPNDTGFEHAAKARDKIYWGKDAPTSDNSGVNSFTWDNPADVNQV